MKKTLVIIVLTVLSVFFHIKYSYSQITVKDMISAFNQKNEVEIYDFMKLKGFEFYDNALQPGDSSSFIYFTYDYNEATRGASVWFAFKLLNDGSISSVSVSMKGKDNPLFDKMKNELPGLGFKVIDSEFLNDGGFEFNYESTYYKMEVAKYYDVGGDYWMNHFFLKK